MRGDNHHRIIIIPTVGSVVFFRQALQTIHFRASLFVQPWNSSFLTNLVQDILSAHKKGICLRIEFDILKRKVIRWNLKQSYKLLIVLSVIKCRKGNTSYTKKYSRRLHGRFLLGKFSNL